MNGGVICRSSLFVVVKAVLLIASLRNNRRESKVIMGKWWPPSRDWNSCYVVYIQAVREAHPSVSRPPVKFREQRPTPFARLPRYTSPLLEERARRVRPVICTSLSPNS
ncbi:hypothetical protein TNCV_1510741 [Trichonephila clavipes]|nr:hypothetical protein TNCV_1510741 [Trichonephila clavipes]